jgi:hypothetical protein
MSFEPRCVAQSRCTTAVIVTTIMMIGCGSATSSDPADASEPSVATGVGGGGGGGASVPVGGSNTGGAGGTFDLLNDSDNCGWEGHSCLGGTCAEGLCPVTVLTTACNPGDVSDNVSAEFPCGHEAINGITTKGPDVVWLLGGEGIGYGTLYRGAKTGGTAETLEKLLWRPRKFAHDGQDMLFAYGNGIGRLGLNDSVATLAVPFVGPEGVVRTPLGLVWHHHARQLWHMTLPDGTPELVIDLDPQVTAEFNYAIQDFVVVGSDIIYLDCSGQETDASCAVRRVSLSGVPSAPLATDQGFIDCLDVDDASVYWDNSEAGFDGEIRQVSLTGGSVTTLTVVDDGSQATAIVVDGDSIYSIMGGGVFRVDKATGARAQLARVLGGIRGHGCQRVAVDDTHLYFVDSRGKLQRVPK